MRSQAVDALPRVALSALSGVASSGHGVALPRAFDAASVADRVDGPLKPTAVFAARVNRVALSVQRELSKARIALGEADLALQRRPNPSERVALTGRRDAAQRNVDLWARREDRQMAQPLLVPEVEKARFVVTLERLAELEAERGATEAARIARQTYYAGFAWDRVAGDGITAFPSPFRKTTHTPSEAQLDAAGLPHGKWNTDNAAGGYDGSMRTPDGVAVDMGHAFCGIDWQVNQRHARGGWTIEAVTLGGDLASAMARTKSAGMRDAANAFADETDSDYNGDIDGLNIAKRLEVASSTTMSRVIAGYYASGGAPTRIEELARTSRYVIRDANGTPKRTRDGRYALDAKAIRKDTGWLARLMSAWALRFEPIKQPKQNAVIEAFAHWLD